LKYFLSFRNFEELALVLKTEFALKFFTVLKYFLPFRNFEQLALALKTEFALKFFKPGGMPLPCLVRLWASYAYVWSSGYQSGWYHSLGGGQKL